MTKETDTPPVIRGLWTTNADQTDNDRATIRSEERSQDHEAAITRDLKMDIFIRRITTAVVIFVLVSVTVAGIPIVVSLYRSVFGG